jgi:hypothetical protein
VLTAPAANHITVLLTQPLTSFWPAAQNTWFVTPKTASVLLPHLPNTAVVGLADGNVVTGATDATGKLNLPEAASDITIGLGFQAQLKSLYLDVGSAPTNLSKRSTVPAVTLQLVNTRGLKCGYDFTSEALAEVKERSGQAMGQAIALYTGPQRVLIPPKYQYPGQVAAQQDNPLPATILGLIPEITVGDT